MPQPQQPSRPPPPCGVEESADGFSLQCGLHVLGSGKDDRNAGGRGDACRINFGDHASGADRGAPTGKVDALEILFGPHIRDLPGGRLGRALGVERIHIAEQDQRVGVHMPRGVGAVVTATATDSLGNTSVGRHRVVLIDDGHHTEFQQSAERPVRIAVVTAPGDVIHGEQDQSHAKSVMAEEPRVLADQQPLPDRCRGLLL